MTRTFTHNDAPEDGLQGKRLVLAGFGNQASNQAQCLQDEGLRPVIGLRRGSDSWNRAEAMGFTVLELTEAVQAADILLMLTPDETQADLYNEVIDPHLPRGAALGFAHGFAIGFELLKPRADLDVFMVAPKAQGKMVRKLYRQGRGAAALVAVAQDPTGSAWPITLAYAAALGCLRTGALETSFREEAVSDLFGEQTVLCGGLSELIRAAFDTLVARGYRPEIAYFECLHEVKILADLIHARGIDGMRKQISGTALYGDLSRGRRVIDSRVRENMAAILDEIESGDFAREWVAENRAGKPKLKKLIQRDAEHPIEKIGPDVRAMMPWLEEEL